MKATTVPGAWRRRVQAWSEKRATPTDTLVLTQRNIYILPSRAGRLFALTIVVLLVASINYQLNLGYVLTFLLASSGVVSMHASHNNLRGLSLHLQPVAAGFAGDPATLAITLSTAPGRGRHGIGLRLASSRAIGADASWAWVDVPAGGRSSLQLSFAPERRGLQQAPTISIETRFPLGLFRAWAVWRPAARWIVYPAPERPPAPWPATPATRQDGVARGRTVDGGEPDGVRTYRRGDPLNGIVWKKAARALDTGGELVTRDTRSVVSRELWLDWSQTAGLDEEQRLSRLCAWAVLADHSGVDFGLTLPGRRWAPAHGETHRRSVLEALAVWS